jgi:hypothetical protein
LIEISFRYADEIYAEANLELMFAYDTIRANVVSVWKMKTQTHPRARHGGYEALDKYLARRQIQDSAVTPIAIYFTTRT